MGMDTTGYNVQDVPQQGKSPRCKNRHGKIGTRGIAMAKGYKIFPRGKKFRDNWDRIFIKKDKKVKQERKDGRDNTIRR